MIRRLAAPARPLRRLRPLALAALLLGAAIPDPEDPPRGDLRVVVVSDLNGAYGSTAYDPEVHRAVRLVRETWRPDLVLAAGDLVAGQKPALTDGEVRAMWAAFDSAVGRPLREARIPFGFTLGNHDGSAYPAHRRDRRLAEEHWRAPGHHPGVAFADSAHFPRYYSFTRGGVFVLVWDASFAGTAGERPMLDWARAQLASRPARAARHRLVLGHLPLYAVAEGRNRPGEVLAEADSLRALLERGGVDTYVSGHHHAYYPGRRGRLELLHAGAAGQGPRPLLAGGAPPVKTVTVLDFHFAADSVAYTTYAFDAGAPDGLRRLDHAALPPALHGFNGRVVRRDLPHGAPRRAARLSTRPPETSPFADGGDAPSRSPRPAGSCAAEAYAGACPERTDCGATRRPGRSAIPASRTRRDDHADQCQRSEASVLSLLADRAEARGDAGERGTLREVT